MDVGKRSSLIFKAIYGLLLGIVFLCILIAILDPEKVLQVYPYPGAVAHPYADSVEPGGTSSIAWIDRRNSLYECDVGYGLQYPYCGLVIKYKHPQSVNYDLVDYFELDDATTIDLSDYDGVYISVEYAGPNTALYFFMRSANALPQNSQEYNSLPYLHVDFQAGKDVFVEFSRVQVARWWIDKFDPQQRLRQPTFDKIYELGVELPALPVEGKHRIKLSGIVAKKSYMSQTQLVLVSSGMICIGVLVLLIQILLNHFSVRYSKEAETLRTTMVVDPLTKCLNRLGLETAVKGVFPLSASSNVYVMVLDLDHFKRINDTLGHAAGDEVLRKASAVLSQQLRSDDVFGRWGGEEFIIITRIHRDDLENMVSRLMRSLQEIEIDEVFPVTMSVGVTEAKIGEPFDEAFKRADEAMYKVKQAGRASWKLAS